MRGKGGPWRCEPASERRRVRNLGICFGNMQIPLRFLPQEAVGEVIAVASGEPHTVAIAAGEDAETVVLNLVDPAGTGRRLLGWLGQARLY